MNQVSSIRCMLTLHLEADDAGKNAQKFKIYAGKLQLECDSARGMYYCSSSLQQPEGRLYPKACATAPLVSKTTKNGTDAWNSNNYISNFRKQYVQNVVRGVM